MPFYIFTIGSGLIVLGFTLAVISVTNGLTKIKSPRAKAEILFVGITSVIAGLLVTFMSFKKMVGDERDTMMTTGGNITVLGITTLIQYKDGSRIQKALRYAILGAIIVGFLMCIIYEMFVV